MVKFRSSFFSDESYSYVSDPIQIIYKDLGLNPTYLILRCEKAGEVNSPATIKLDTQKESGPKRAWEVDDTSNLEAICESYLEYKPDSISSFELSPESPLEMIAKDFQTGETLTYIWDSKSKSLKLK
jgi:hypothetical protein